MAEAARTQSTSKTNTPEIDRLWTLLESGRSSGHFYVSLLGLRTFDTAKLLKQVGKGLPFQTWERFVQATEIPAELARSVVQIPSRTLARRKAEGRLHTDESDRLVRMARIFTRALILFEGAAEGARAWLLSSQPALGGATPFEYASTDVGSREVEDLIGRIEHGIPS
jgi:putative toxin-antitoxin system antitoxin component (TIGR02293 family)